MHIHHVGYLVKKMNKAMQAFKELGYEQQGEVVFDEYRGIDICFMAKDGYRVELVSPKGRDSVVYGLQRKYGNSPYHICYECSDMEASVEDLRNQGFVKYDDPHEAVAISNQLVCFLVHPYLGMIELLEVKG